MKSVWFLILLMLVFALALSCGDDDDDSGGGSGDDDDDDSPPMDDDDDDDDDTTTPDDDDDTSPGEPPDAPDELRAVGTGETVIQLSWTDNSGNESGFKIYRQEAATRAFELLATVGPNVPIYLDNDAQCETTYDYQVIAFNSAGESDPSGTAQGETDYCTIAPPSGLSAVAVNETRIDLFWQDNSFNESNFQIQRQETGGEGWFNLADVESNITTFSDLDADCGTDYNYRIRAYNQNSASPWSDPANSTTAACPPVRPRPVLDFISPISYVALSREFLEDPPDPLYPLTISGDGIASDTIVEINDFMLPCDTGGEGQNCEADEYGEPEDCATTCIVSLPEQIMRNADTYVVRLNTPDPVWNGLNTSAYTEFFYVISPIPEITNIWPRGVMQLVDEGGYPIEQNITVKIWGRNLMNNSVIRLENNFAEFSDNGIITDPETGKQFAEVHVSTRNLYPRDEHYEFAVINPSPGGGERFKPFGVNPRIESWSGELLTDLRLTRPSGAFPVTHHRIALQPRGALNSAVHYLGAQGFATVRDEQGKTLSRVSYQSSLNSIPLPKNSRWLDLQEPYGLGRNISLYDSVPLYRSGGSFNDIVEYPMGSVPYYVAASDLNNDGIQDIVTANVQSDNISIRLGKGDGSFQDNIDIEMGDDPYSVAVADLDGDGISDLVTANRNSHNVSIRFGTGNAEFENKTDLPMGQEAIVIVVADLNNDGTLDLITANASSNRVSFRLGNGDGTFGAINSHNMASTGAYFIDVDDLNNDGALDLITASYSDSHIATALGLGDGTFKATSTWTTGYNPLAVTATDLNGDGASDLVSANSFSDSISILLGNGDGTFGDKTDVVVGDHPQALAAADLNGDGVPELVVANADSDNTSILYGVGDGTFNNRIDLLTGSFPTQPASIAISDFNTDGAQDLAVATGSGNSVGIFLGNAATKFGARTNLYVGDRPYSVVIKDLNLDDSPDIVTVNRNSDNVTVLLGNGDGTFQSGKTFGTGDWPRIVAVTNLDSDNIPDIATVNSASDDVSILIGNGDGTFKTKVDYETGDNPLSFLVIDINNDNYDDLVVADYWDTVFIGLNNGNGTFGENAEYYMRDFPHSVTAGYLNEDDYADIVTGNSVGITIRLGNESGTFGDLSVISYFFSPDSMQIADIDLDGKQDIITADGYNNNTVSVFPGEGDGSFGEPVSWVMGQEPNYVHVADLNGDNNPDIISTNYIDNDLSIRLGTGDGDFNYKTDYLMDDTPVSIATGDLDKDGAMDVVSANSESDNISIRMCLYNIPGTWHQELTDSFSDDQNQPWLPKYATAMANTEIQIHQAEQTITKIGATVLLEWTEQPTGSVTLTMHAPDEETDAIELGTFSEFTAWPDDENPTSWRLNKVFRAYDFQGEDGITEFDDWLGLQPTGYWRLSINNQTNADAEVKNWTVLTDGHF